MKSSPLFRKARLGLIALALAYTLFAMGLALFQDSLIFHPQTLSTDHQFKFELPFEERTIEVNGEEMSSLLFRAPKAKVLILYFHGNAGSLAQWGNVGVSLSKKLGASVWLLDYPGYGKSEGKILNEEQLATLGREFIQTARKEFPQTKLIVIGRSIGTGIAVRAAAEQGVEGLILETPFYNLPDLVGKIMPWAPRFLLKYSFANNEWLPKVKAPILLIHGTEDELIPYSQGQRLAATLESRAKFIAIQGGHHNDLASYELYWAALQEYFAKL